MKDTHEHIRNRPVLWIDTDVETPAEWHNGFPQCNQSLHEFRFKILLAGGREYYSSWTNGGWKIQQANPRFVVTHWVKPIFIA